jgi:hypothetical protein
MFLGYNAMAVVWHVLGVHEGARGVRGAYGVCAGCAGSCQRVAGWYGMWCGILLSQYNQHLGA